MSTVEEARFDAARYKDTTRRQWDAAAEAWDRWAPFLRRWLGPATERMLDLAAVRPDARVLDVAAGAGDQSLVAAERVGTRGYVLATDLSGPILDRAAANARRAGLSTVLETRVLDGEALEVAPGSFDAVVSRLGLIYFPDQARALAGMFRALRPGGRAAAIVYSTADRNPFFALPVGIIRRRAALPAPAPGQPGPFSLGASGVLEGALTSAGFVDVRVERIDAPLELASAAECVRFERESFGALHQMLSGLDPSAREAAWQEIAESLARFEGHDGFRAPCELLVAGGRRPD